MYRYTNKVIIIIVIKNFKKIVPFVGEKLQRIWNFL